MKTMKEKHNESQLYKQIYFTDNYSRNSLVINALSV